jgi:hypothetical protein
MTIVLKFPLTSAASTKGLHRYSGFDNDGTTGDWGTGGGCGCEDSCGEKVAEVGVGDRLGPRGLRAMERLTQSHIVKDIVGTKTRGTYPMELKKDMFQLDARTSPAGE